MHSFGNNGINTSCLGQGSWGISTKEVFESLHDDLEGTYTVVGGVEGEVALLDPQRSKQMVDWHGIH